jgi:hypothetical protein
VLEAHVPETKERAVTKWLLLFGCVVAGTCAWALVAGGPVVPCALGFVGGVGVVGIRISISRADADYLP